MIVSLGERITNVEELRTWKDKIPLHYVYTAGVAGERFLRGIKDGKILASQCPDCDKLYLPPKMYCVECFVSIDKYKEVGPSGTVSAVSTSHVGFDGSRLDQPRTYVFVTYKGVTGGIVQVAAGHDMKVGAKVVPRYKAQGERTGSLLDFEFVHFKA